MALRVPPTAAPPSPQPPLDAGREYVRRSAANGGGFSYQPGGPPNQARTGTGILSMELLGQHDSAEAKSAGDWLLRNPPDNPGMEFYYYAVYYNAQALNQLGGVYWSTLIRSCATPCSPCNNPTAASPAAAARNKKPATPTVPPWRCWRSACRIGICRCIRSEG